MKQFGLIIQETTAGSNQQFVSSHLDINSLEIKVTIVDERTLASQLANLSDVYSVQITSNYKIYSLIITDHTDFLGRSGYYAIRLYGPKDVNLTNFENILANIKEKYNGHSASNTLNDQDYDAILSSILIVENDKKALLSLQNNLNCYYYFDEVNSVLSTVFNTRGIHLVNKVYAFNKNKALPEEIALKSGLKSFSQINSSQKEINLINNHGLLKELKINDKNIVFNTRLSEYNILCQANDVVTYNTLEEKNFKIINNNFISIEKKLIPRTPIQRGITKQSSLQEYGVYLIMGLLLLLIGTGSWYFFLRDNKLISPPIHNQISNQEANQNLTSIETNINFELDEKEKDSVYKTNYQGLSKYRFKYYNNKWSYKNSAGKNIYNYFYFETIEEINSSQSLNLSDSAKKQFLKSLKEKSGHEVKSKEIVIRTDRKRPEAKPIEKVKKITGKKNEVNSKITTPKAPTDNIPKNSI